MTDPYSKAVDRAREYAKRHGMSIVKELGSGTQGIVFSTDCEKREQFESRWPEVQLLIRQFRSYGIYLADVKPGNVMFDGDDE
jgi:hypothetical protein